MYERRRITEFLFGRKTIGGKSRRFGFVTIIQERKWEGWVDIAWDDFDTPCDLASYTDSTLPVPEPPTFPIEHQGWGEDYVAQGEYTIKREIPARQCTFATWTVNGRNHPGFARIYGKGNAQRIADTLTACYGMDNPVQDVQGLKARPSTVLEALQGLRAEEVAAALLKLSETRDGFAYDVGMALYKAGAGKEVLGPDPHDPNPKSVNSGSVVVEDFDPGRRADAIKAFRDLWGYTIPTYDESDPKWLKATRAERKVAKTAAENYVKYGLDAVPEMISTLERGRANQFFTGYSRSEFAKDAPKTRAEAEAEVARFASYGVKARVEGYEAPPASHRVSLHDLSRGPFA